MIMSNATTRCDSTGRAFAGSQRQIQTYVNERPAELSSAVADALAAYAMSSSAIRWVSPLASESYCEYRDADFLEALGLGHLASKLRQFWPRGGPCWDALAQIDGGGCILVEAKSHVPEIYGGGCTASPRSLPLIQSALSRTKLWLGASPDADWTGCSYQSANRIASLYFLREIGRVNAYLVNVYFTDDPHSRTSRQQWDIAIKQVNEQLGMTQDVPYSGSVFLEAPIENA
jgi:hypothetical protein